MDSLETDVKDKSNLNFYPKYECILFVEQIPNKDRLNMLCYWKKALGDQNNVYYAELRGSAEIPYGYDYTYNLYCYFLCIAHLDIYPKFSFNCDWTFFYYISGDYVLYWSFDTLENLALMRLNNASDFDSLVPGQVISVYC